MDIEGIFWYHLGDSKEVEKMRFFLAGRKNLRQIQNSILYDIGLF